MSKNLRTHAAFLMLAAAAVGFSFAPTTEATPVTYDFTVSVNSGDLAGTTESGSFSYDSNSVVRGATNKATGLLTALDFTFNGILYDASTANTGSLSFDAVGNLTGFWFGNSCTPGKCGLITRGDSWFVHRIFGSAAPDFGYTALDSRGRSLKPGAGQVGYSLAPLVPVPVPEPATLGLFGLGALMIGLFGGTRRRMG